MSDNFYRAFEDKYRGSRELIKSRLEAYLPFVKKIKEIEPEPKAIDLGCGRGEWLELLGNNGIKAKGIDLDTGMLEACTNRGFDVDQKDAIFVLKELEDESVDIVSGFHIVEHLPFDVLQSLVQESLRVLKPGGLIILETPNPENIEVATVNFYLDPTHIRPIPSLLLSFLTEYYGFGRTKVICLQESQELYNAEFINLSQVISGVSPDYAVVAQKQAPVEIMSSFDELFNREYGLSLETLANKFENRLLKLESHTNEVIAKAEQAQTQANDAIARAEQFELKANEAIARAEQFELKANEAWHHYAMVVNCRSWKLTYPLRLIGKTVKWFFRGSIAWLTFSPTSRPRRAVKKMAIVLKEYINAHPKLKLKLMRILNHFPMLKAKLNQIENHEVNYTNFISNRVNRELLVDITHIYTEDLKTGIQRVVRSILNELENNDTLKNIDIQPIFLTDKDGFWCYRYVKKPNLIVVPKENDIFLGLDLNAAITEAAFAGLFDDWKLRRVQINFVVYDILPILNPHWWQQGVNLAHEEWLKTVLSYSDKIFCISQTVSDDVNKYITKYQSSMLNNSVIDWFHLGADIENSTPSNGMPDDAEFVLNQLTSKPSFLMVGTIEPRKAQDQTLLAFEKLWADGVDINLIIAGKRGWMVDRFIEKVRNHPELNKRLFWIEGASDEYLEKVYTTAICLIAASEGEGFGLPLIEAAQYKLPIIARDIPVFREVAGEFAYYFSNDNDPSVLAVTIMEWLKLYKANNHPESDKMHWLTWQESTKKIVNLLDI